MGSIYIFERGQNIGNEAAEGETTIHSDMDGDEMDRDFLCKRISGWVHIGSGTLAASQLNTVEGSFGVSIGHKSDEGLKVGLNAVNTVANMDDPEAYAQEKRKQIRVLIEVPMHHQVQTDSSSNPVAFSGRKLYKFTKTFKKPVPILRGQGFRVEYYNWGANSTPANTLLTYKLKMEGALLANSAGGGF